MSCYTHFPHLNRYVVDLVEWDSVWDLGMLQLHCMKVIDVSVCVCSLNFFMKYSTRISSSSKSSFRYVVVESMIRVCLTYSFIFHFKVVFENQGSLLKSIGYLVLLNSAKS
jgi:hypothetical protein